mmetsp:Transcript_24631/g.62359  ORF Transcript_24631/g.62359 Transcript_24631/m.62359 type:complete len:102 (-) Transcript_24631:1757-2062(-)
MRHSGGDPPSYALVRAQVPPFACKRREKCTYILAIGATAKSVPLLQFKSGRKPPMSGLRNVRVPCLLVYANMHTLCSFCVIACVHARGKVEKWTETPTASR